MSNIVSSRAFFEEESISEQELRHRSSTTIEENRMIPLFIGQRKHRKRLNLFQILLYSLIFITLIFVIYSSLSLSPILRFLDPYSYVLVFDAGSTGTRIHVYKFRSTTDNDNGNTFILKSEIFEERKPGLSSFADRIDDAEKQIDQLLQIADREVSRFKHRNTPLVLRATAGLRLISETKQKLLLESVAKTFAKYGFYRPKLDIAIMDEIEEGIDAWLTLVYLKGEQFYGSRIAALDLGGGSTQITYNPSLSNTTLAEKLNLLLKAQQPVQPGQIHAFRDPENKNKKQMPKIDVNQAGLEEIQPAKLVHPNDLIHRDNDRTNEEEMIMKYMQQFRMFGRDIKLYSRSYLGYGLMIARQTIFANDTNDPQLVQSHQLKTRCFLPKTNGKFKFQEINWIVQPIEDVNNEERFYSCLSIVDRYVELNVQPAVGLDQMSIYVFSYFYDIANDAGLLTNEGGSSSITTLTIRVLKQTAKTICRDSTRSMEHPFLCFDMIYIYSLLTKGYGLSEDIQLNICKKIQQFEVAWSLGLALKLL